MNSQQCVCSRLFLKDLTFIEDGNPDMIDEKRLNFDKIAMIGNTLRTIHAYQNVDYNRKITALLRHLASLPRLSEEELNRSSERQKPLKLQDTGSVVALVLSSSSDSFSLTEGSSSDDYLNHRRRGRVGGRQSRRERNGRAEHVRAQRCRGAAAVHSGVRRQPALGAAPGNRSQPFGDRSGGAER